MNSGFRNLLGWKDTTKFKAYLIAVALQMIILPPMIARGFIHANIPLFYPLAAILGGIVFGLAMNWGGGCAGGVLYKAGSGNIGALVTVIMIIFGYVAAEAGILKRFRVLLQSAKVAQISPQFFSITFQTIVPVVIGTLLLIYLLKYSPPGDKSKWGVRKTGIIVGAVSILAWIFSSVSGRFYGMAVLPGEKQAFDFLTISAEPGWDLLFVIGIPLGGYISAQRKNEFQWSNISGTAIWKMAGGGFAMGTAASLAGGCTVGHSLTGVPLLSFQSLAFTLSAIAGAVSSARVTRALKN